MCRFNTEDLDNLEDREETLEELAIALDVVALDEPLEEPLEEPLDVVALEETETLEDFALALALETMEVDEFAIEDETLEVEEIAPEVDDQRCVLFFSLSLDLSYSVSLPHPQSIYRWPVRFIVFVKALNDNSAVKSDGGPDVIMGPSSSDMCLVVPAPIQDAPFNIFNDQVAFLAGCGRAFVANGMEIHAMPGDTSGTFCMFHDGDMKRITLQEARLAHPMVSFK